MKSFADIIAQESALRLLSRAFLANHLPHGLIFAGPTGIGKATTAAALCALFLCPSPILPPSAGPYPRPCGQCESCRLFAASTHPDFHNVYKELIRYHDKYGTSKGINLSIDVIRAELIGPAALKSTLGHGKAFIIEQSDLMTHHAQNALLKTLEEPAGRSLFILLTDQPASLLPTIRSRCQLIGFSPLPDPVIRRQLADRNIPPDIADQAVDLAEGSLGLALRWIEDDLITSAQQIRRIISQFLAGRLPDENLPDCFKKSADQYADKQLQRDKLASRDQAAREALNLFLHFAAQPLRRQLRTETHPARLERLCNTLDALARAADYLDSNVNITLIFQQLAAGLQLQYLSPTG